MNIEEAYAAASAGFRITHMYFSANEYLENRFGFLVAEDGVRFDEEFVLRVQSKDWNADGWSIRDERTGVDFGHEILLRLEADLPLAKKHLKHHSSVSFSPFRPSLSLLVEQVETPELVCTTITDEQVFVESLVRNGLPEAAAKKASCKLIKWLKTHEYKVLLSNPLAFYSEKAGLTIQFKTSWQPLRPLDLLIKYYE